VSVCDGCGADDIFGKRAERQSRQDLVWLCRPCRQALLGQEREMPASRDPLDYLPLVRIAAAVLVIVSAILAAGAHW